MVTLTETWLNGKVHNGLIRIPEYKLYRWDRKSSKRGGGITAYVHNKLKVDASRYEDLNVSDQDAEIFTLAVNQKCSKVITIITVYRPPQGNQKRCVEKLREVVQSVNKFDDIIIMGDLNIDYATKKSAKELIALEREFGLKQQINTPTRVTQQTKTVIDHIYTNSSKVRGSGVLMINISDHYPVFVVLKKLPIIYERVSFKCRQLKDLNVEELAKQLNGADWEKFYKATDVDVMWNEMYNIYLSVLNRLCPLVEYVNVRRKQSWITPNLFELMKKRDYCYKIAQRTGNKDDWVAAKRQRNLTNDACSRAKGEFIKQKLKDDEGNPKKFWGHLAPLLKETKQEQTSIELDGSDSTNTVPNMFNQFFSSVGVNLKSKIKPLNEEEKKKIENSRENNNKKINPRFEFRRTNTIEVEAIIKRLHNHKASGVPTISSYLLKECFRATINQTVCLINMSIETSTVPETWKRATITPVHKGGSPRIPDNYRPISI